MRGTSPVVAGLLLLAATAGLLGLTGTPAVPEPSPTPSPPPSESRTPEPSPSPEPVPVETALEDWSQPKPEPTPAPEPEPEPEPEVQSLPAAAEVFLELKNDTDYEIQFQELPALPSGLDVMDQAPTILIVHTHTTECYEGDGAAGVYRSTEADRGVMAVGEVMAETLAAGGYTVIHDTTFCDYPEYEGAYDRSRAVIQAELAEHPSICLVLDLHRDAVEDGDGNQLALTASTPEGTAAQVMLVVGTDEGGLLHPDWRTNLSLAAVLQSEMNREAPGLMRPINLRPQRFNQDLGPMALLVEVGASGNTLEEACSGGVYLARAICRVLDQYNSNYP